MYARSLLVAFAAFATLVAADSAMANESKTANLAREHFSEYREIVCIEEQQSDIPKVRKLLKNASKKGEGKGYPDFIITYKTNPELLIAIECKANAAKHESSKRDQYAGYAVDGSLLYASYLSKGYDVIAIAVSGEITQGLTISHFLHLQGERQATEVFGDKLLSAGDYLNGYLQSPEKFRQDYNALLAFAKILNEELYTQKIIESQRSLLISSILIALENPAFKRSYASHRSAKGLANALIHTVTDELERANIGADKADKLENLSTQFSFIKTHRSLSMTPDVLKKIIDDIDENINQFIKTHEYFDVLGQLYLEFLRYANSDKGLGIVLTPPHIAELFSELAQVNKNSVVYDNCTGTGGFLISAMKRMIADAKGDTSQIRQIKDKGLIGIEYQSHIFALAISNMYIHQDGKTSIINGNCFDPKVIETVKNRKPTVGLLNPPYKANKKTDIDELEFVLNNMECLVDGGTCVAIVPMQSALANQGKIYELKKKILSRHSLEAVLSMPDELFFNSKVGVVSCVMVLTAHKPHPTGKKTYFGYYKNDGFLKKKAQGRCDAYGAWDSIREQWVANFLNKSPKAGFSATHEITPDSEWAAEAYLETDYRPLADEHFVNALLNYSAFLFRNRLIAEASSNQKTLNKVILSTEDWRFFSLEKDLFEIAGSRTTSLDELEEYKEGQYPYVTTQATNNGVGGFYDHYTETEAGGVLAIDSAVVGYCSYQPYHFSASDHVEKLTPKFEMNQYTAMFLTVILNMEQYRYNYGRKASQARLKSASIKLPVSPDGAPDWKFMESYIKSLPYASSI